jgi:hypothetical protein
MEEMNIDNGRARVRRYRMDLLVDPLEYLAERRAPPEIPSSSAMRGVARLPGRSAWMEMHLSAHHPRETLSRVVINQPQPFVQFGHSF